MLKSHTRNLSPSCQSRFLELFGDPIFLEENDSYPALGDVCIMKAGKFIKATAIKPEYTAGYYPCYGGNGIRGYVATFNQEGEHPLIGRQGALCGNVQYAMGRFYATEHAVVVTPKNDFIDRLWLYHLLLKLNLGRYASGAAQPGIAVNKLDQIRVRIPQLDKQQQFSTIVRQTTKSKLVNPAKPFQVRNLTPIPNAKVFRLSIPGRISKS